MLESTLLYTKALLSMVLNKKIDDITIDDIKKEIEKEYRYLAVEKISENGDNVEYGYCEFKAKVTKKTSHILIDEEDSFPDILKQLNVSKDKSKKIGKLLPHIGEAWDGKGRGSMSFNDEKEKLLYLYFYVTRYKASYSITKDKKIVNYSILPNFDTIDKYTQYLKIFKKIIDRCAIGNLSSKKHFDKNKVEYIMNPNRINFLSNDEKSIKYNNFDRIFLPYLISSFINKYSDKKEIHDIDLNLGSLYVISSNGASEYIKYNKYHNEFSKDNILYFLIKSVIKGGISKDDSKTNIYKFYKILRFLNIETMFSDIYSLGYIYSNDEFLELDNNVLNKLINIMEEKNVFEIAKEYGSFIGSRIYFHTLSEFEKKYKKKRESFNFDEKENFYKILNKNKKELSYVLDRVKTKKQWLDFLSYWCSRKIGDVSFDFSDDFTYNIDESKLDEIKSVFGLYLLNSKKATN
ncbi:MAG: hypothetical protein ACOCVF_03200 [bacterium]